MSTVLDRPAPPAAPARRSSGWGPALRIARRELARARGRTVLVLLMVLLPVVAVVTLDTLLRTGDISVEEGLGRNLGGAQARIDPAFGAGVRQSPDASRFENGGGAASSLAEREVRAALPAGTGLLAVRQDAQARLVRSADGDSARVDLLGLDLREPSTRGPYALRSGRAPATAGEVAVTAPLLERGFDVGTTLLLGDDERTVTGVVAFPRDGGSSRSVVGLPAAVGLADVAPVRYYASGPPVRWEDVLELNALGAVVLSRSVVLDPPPEEAVPPLASYDDAAAAVTAAIIGLITVMAVLEVVLLAGPAFAIGARRQRRALALLAASGGEPRHVRRVVLAQGLLVGLGAAVLGVPLGIAVAALARDPLTRYAGTEWGPFEVNARDVVLLGLLGAATAVLAALLPAVVAGRQPVVAGLRGRRLAPVRAATPTALGLALFLVGGLMCAASLGQPFPELWVAFSALPTVIGAVLLAPALLAAGGRAAGRMPLSLRYALRDADRQRSRTAPAVAAIAATVAAVVALGTAASSDQAEASATYVASGPPGVAVVSSATGSPDLDWLALEGAARQALPDEPVLPVRGLSERLRQPGEPYETVQVCLPEDPPAVYCDGARAAYGGSALGSSVLVGPEVLEVLGPLLDPASLAAATAAVSDGGAAVAATVTGPVELRRQLVRTPTGPGPETAELLSAARTPATPLRGAQAYPPVLAVVSERVAQELGGVATVGLLVGDGLDQQQEERLTDALLTADPGVSVHVERGFEEGGDGLVVLLLGLVAGTLVLAGTLAASSLALVEARPDFTTLGQVGARPGTRRRVAAAYAFVLALLGSALGIAGGLVPGVAAAVALTRYGYAGGGVAAVPSLLSRVEVPWLLLAGLLLALPLLVAALAAAVPREGRARTGAAA